MKKITSLVLVLFTLALFPDMGLGSTPDLDNQVLLLFEGAATQQMTVAEFLSLEQLTVSLRRTNSKGKTTTGTYSGVHWTVLAKAIGAQDAQSIQVVAADGFEQIYPLGVLKEASSLFALYQDGERIGEEGQIWFCASENYTANYWSKFIVKIVVR